MSSSDGEEPLPCYPACDDQNHYLTTSRAADFVNRLSFERDGGRNMCETLLKLHESCQKPAKRQLLAEKYDGMCGDVEEEYERFAGCRVLDHDDGEARN